VTVICNTTPLINFAAINRLDILQAMFGQIVIPQAVYDETKKSDENLDARVDILR
jgi:predicted nucleic acid-binding protein